MVTQGSCGDPCPAAPFSNVRLGPEADEEGTGGTERRRNAERETLFSQKDLRREHVALGMFFEGTLFQVGFKGKREICDGKSKEQK